MRYLLVLFSVLAGLLSAGDPQPPKKCELCSNDVLPGIIATECKWIHSSDRVLCTGLDVQCTDHRGATKHLKNLLSGAPSALTFIYTRCDNPNKCPLVVSTVKKLRSLLDNADAKDVRLFVMTYDPEYDTPAVLGKYSEMRGMSNFENLLFLQPAISEKMSLFETLKLSVNYTDDRVNIHGIQLIIFDRLGRIAKSYRTLIWNNDLVVKDLLRLKSE